MGTIEKKKKEPQKKTRRSALQISQIEAALRATGGFVTYAAKQLGVTHQAVTLRIKNSPQLQRVQDEVRESYLDLAEHALLKKIRDEDLGAICFYLKCQGRNRGYIERPKEDQMSESAAQPVKVVIEVQDGRKS